jgi:hypothetical protein
MDTLNISTGEKRISITRDDVRVGELVFSPNDVVFVEKFYRLIGTFQTKLDEYQAQNNELDKDQSTDENGIPTNAGERIALLREACTFIREQVDGLFGPGTSQIVFGDALSLDAFQQFFTSITPFIQTVRVEKIQKYTNTGPKRSKK